MVNAPPSGNKSEQLKNPSLLTMTGIRILAKNCLETVSGRKRKEARATKERAETDFDTFHAEFNEGGDESANDPEKVLILTEKALPVNQRVAKLYCDYAIGLYRRLGILDGPMYDRLCAIAKQLGIEHRFKELGLEFDEKN